MCVCTQNARPHSCAIAAVFRDIVTLLASLSSCSNSGIPLQLGPSPSSFLFFENPFASPTFPSPPAAATAHPPVGASTFVRTLWAEPADDDGDDEDSSDAEAEAALMHKYGIS